jgi:FSR family fosmidomycin resistance protein-like MFS transporter
VPALLPFLIAQMGLTYTMASALVLACSVVSAVIQPLFGYLGDRINSPWFMGLGILLAGVGVSMVGWASSYGLLIACTATTGVGVALFHPEGGKLANVLASRGKASSVSNFSVGGYTGFAIGPVLVTLAVGTLGLKGTMLFLIPSALTAAVIFKQAALYRRLSAEELARRQEAAESESSGQDDWAGFMKITAVNFLRSIVSNGVTVFMPLSLIALFMLSEQGGALALTAYSGAGALATFIGGLLADRFGMKRMVITGFSLTFPLLLAFTLSPSLPLAIASVIGAALAMGSAYSSIIVLGQGYLPNKLGLASGISMGVVVSVGGIASPLLGMVGDAWGLKAVMTAICVIAALTLAASMLAYRHRDSV